MKSAIHQRGAFAMMGDGVDAARALRSRPDVSPGGFNLLELLLVMTLIVVLLGAMGVALGERGGRGAALQSAQVALATALAAARSQATLQQTPARLLVHASPPPAGDVSKYLRCFQVVREDPAGSGQWIAVGEPIYFPNSILLVPPTMDGNQLVEGLAWPAAALSTLAGPAAIALDEVAFGEAYYVEFGADGRPTGAVNKLVVATAQAVAGAIPRFDNPSSVRGVRLRETGALSFIDEANAL